MRAGRKDGRIPSASGRKIVGGRCRSLHVPPCRARSARRPVTALRPVGSEGTRCLGSRSGVPQPRSCSFGT